jgi:hypothetical protein
MPNLRIVSDNAIDRAASLVASSAAGELVASNLQLEIKSRVWRATGASATLTATWNAAEPVSCVALPFCNLSPSATIRVRGYSDAGGGSLVLDTGAVAACPAPAVVLRGWGALLSSGANAYGYGGGAYARAWFGQVNVRRLVVDLADGGNAAGYIEASRLIAGAYWSPVYNADSGAALTLQDQSNHYRTDAGDLMTDIGARNRKLSLNLLCMPPADRAAFASILRGNGMANPLFLSLFPEDADVAMERDHQIYGKASQMSAVTLAQFGAYSSQLEIEEV